MTEFMGIIFILGFVYAIWLLIFPILLYSRLGEIYKGLGEIHKTTNFIAKFSSYKKIYYCPKCLELSLKECNCSKCGNVMELKA